MNFAVRNRNDWMEGYKSIDETQKVLKQWILNENIYAIVYQNGNKVIDTLRFMKIQKRDTKIRRNLGAVFKTIFHLRTE